MFGWLDKLTNWLREQILAVWDAVVQFFGDLIVETVEAVLDVVVLGLNAVPAPDFLTTYSMDALLSQAGPTIMWIVGTFKISECMAILSAGYSFRMVRKLFTLGLW